MEVLPLYISYTEHSSACVAISPDLIYLRHIFEATRQIVVMLDYRSAMTLLRYREGWGELTVKILKELRQNKKRICFSHSATSE